MAQSWPDYHLVGVNEKGQRFACYGFNGNLEQARNYCKVKTKEWDCSKVLICQVVFPDGRNSATGPVLEEINVN